MKHGNLYYQRVEVLRNNNSEEKTHFLTHTAIFMTPTKAVVEFQIKTLEYGRWVPPLMS
jgi:hypothetical protein